jgi:hypothetical protein
VRCWGYVGPTRTLDAAIREILHHTVSWILEMTSTKCRHPFGATRGRPPAYVDERLSREKSERARRRIAWGNALFASGELDAAGYHSVRAIAEAQLEAAESELEAAHRLNSTQHLPTARQLKKDARRWAIMLRAQSVADERIVLAHLVRDVQITRTGWGQYRVDLTWTPLGLAIAQVAEESGRARLSGHVWHAQAYRRRMSHGTA